MPIGTKNVDVNTSNVGGFIPRQLQPSNAECAIRSIKMERAEFLKDIEAYHLVLNLESRPVGGKFEGFAVDAADPSKGKLAGQSAFVKMSEYTYQNGNRGGTEIDRDAEMLKDIKRLCIELGCTEWFDNADGKYNTMQEFVQAFNAEKPFKDIWMHYCIAGKEYVNKGGYKAYELFLPYQDRLGRPYSKDKTKVQTFFESAHIRLPKVKENGSATQLAKVNGTNLVKENEESPFKDTFLEEINAAVPVTHTDIVENKEEDELPFTLD